MAPCFIVDNCLISVSLISCLPPFFTACTTCTAGSRPPCGPRARFPPAVARSRSQRLWYDAHNRKDHRHWPLLALRFPCAYQNPGDHCSAGWVGGDEKEVAPRRLETGPPFPRVHITLILRTIYTKNVGLSRLFRPGMARTLPRTAMKAARARRTPKQFLGPAARHPAMKDGRGPGWFTAASARGP